MPKVIERETLALVAALIMLFGVVVIAYRSAGAAESTLALIEQTGMTLKQIDRVNTDYARAVTARRAYVISGDRSQLDQLPDLDAALNRSQSLLRQSLTGDSMQQRRLDTLALAIDARLRDLDAAASSAAARARPKTALPASFMRHGCGRFVKT